MGDTQKFAEILHALRKLNVRIAIDDFGTGYSSLSRLKEMSVDCLKIDSSFISGFSDFSGNHSIVCAIIAMAESLNLTVIAEGVETPVQVDFLRGNRCQKAQGFLFSRPMPPSLAEIFLRKRAYDTEENGFRCKSGN